MSYNIGPVVIYHEEYFWNLKKSYRPTGYERFMELRSSLHMTISHSELVSLMEKSKGLLLVDVRSQEEVAKGCIPGSVHVPVSSVESVFSLEPDAFRDATGVPKPLPDSQDLVFHCQMGRRGEVATDIARRLGFKNARNYTGGYKEWSEKQCK